MALPADGQNANDLTKVTEIPAGKELIFFDPTTNEGGIITLENLTKQILNGLTKQTFALDAGQQTILQALNTLNSDSYRDILAVSGTAEQSVAISDQYNTPLILALFESDKKVLDMKSIPLNFAIQSRTISVYNPKDLSIYVEVVTDKINNTITLKHYGTGFARIYVR